MKAKKGSGRLQTKHLERVVACKICLFSLYFVKYMMFITLHALWNEWSPFLYNSALRKFYFRGLWSVSPKNRGQSKKTEGWTGLKKMWAVVWQWVPTFKEAVPPPPWDPGYIASDWNESYAFAIPDHGAYLVIHLLSTQDDSESKCRRQ